MSTRETAIDEMRTRLRNILVANGYNTDVGQVVMLGEQPEFGPDDPDAVVALIVGDDVPGYQGEHVVVMLPVEAQAIVKADVDDPWTTVEAVIADIKKAVETDRDLGGSLVRRGLERGTTRPFDRESGSTFVGAGVEYRLQFKELWGAP